MDEGNVINVVNLYNNTTLDREIYSALQVDNVSTRVDELHSEAAYIIS